MKRLLIPILGVLAVLVTAGCASGQTVSAQGTTAGCATPNTANRVVGGVYPLQSDITTGQLCTNASGGDAAAGPTGSAVPSNASYTGFSLAGVLTGVSSANPLPISGPVTNAGTFAVQNTSATPAGTNVIGHVITDTGSVTADSIANGSDVALGSTTDTAAASGVVTATAIALFKAMVIAQQSTAPVAVTGPITPGTTNPTSGAFAITDYDYANSLARNARADSSGGLIGGTLTGTSTRTTLTANASTALPGAASTTRPSYFRITVETTLTANLFLCLNNQTCSATAYDEMIPSGAAAGTRLFEEIPFALAVNYFTTGTPTVNAARLAN